MREGRYLTRFLINENPTHPNPWSIAICAILLGLCSSQVAIAGVFASVSIGALFTLRAPIQTRAVLGILVVGLIVQLESGVSLAYAIVLAQTLVAAFAPRRLVSAVMSVPRWTWHIMSVLAAASICAMLLGFGPAPTALALVTSGYLGVNVTRNLAMRDAHLLSWGDENLIKVTRDLLLGRVTSGMLHDLSQPLNVISMANGNMGYIVDRLDIDADDRRHLQERIERIGQHTQNAAEILSLFRWFGRDGSDNAEQHTVRNAFARAIAVTRSNARHNDVAVKLEGDGLDYLLPKRLGCLEIMAVAALLCALSSFVDANGTKKGGTVRIVANLKATDVMISLHSTDDMGQPVQGKTMDTATRWLVEQVAKEASGDFRALYRRDSSERFLIRLRRDDR